jgi:hypothetical protein
VADRFTAFDRRLLAAADAQGWGADGVGGNDAWAALTRGRLRHLEGVKAGFHDEAGAAPYVVVRDAASVEHYARLRTGSPRLEVGRTATLAMTTHGLGQVVTGRGADLGR